MKNKILAIIPARGGSKGVPRKNIKVLNGKPLIAYTIEAAKKSKYIDRVVVSTEDDEIAKISEKLGAEVPYLRPNELAKDDSSTVDCIIHMVNWLKKNQGYVTDYVCVLQCTSPLRGYKDIDGTICKLLETNMDGAVSICEAEINPYWTNIFDGNSIKYFIKEGKNIKRRQDLPLVYRINGAVYIIKTSELIANKTLEPESMTAFVMKNDDSIDIDTINDFIMAELIIKSKEGIK